MSFCQKKFIYKWYPSSFCIKYVHWILNFNQNSSSLISVASNLTVLHFRGHPTYPVKNVSVFNTLFIVKSHIGCGLNTNEVAQHDGGAAFCFHFLSPPFNSAPNILGERPLTRRRKVFVNHRASLLQIDGDRIYIRRVRSAKSDCRRLCIQIARRPPRVPSCNFSKYFGAAPEIARVHCFPTSKCLLGQLSRR